MKQTQSRHITQNIALNIGHTNEQRSHIRNCTKQKTNYTSISENGIFKALENCHETEQ